MESRKVIRYYSDCGRGFWKKQQALVHDENCKCWKNPKLYGCLSCANKHFIRDSDGAQSWDYNNCQNSESGVPVHEDFEHIRKNCSFWKPIK